jgi:hypothetical protein
MVENERNHISNEYDELEVDVDDEDDILERMEATVSYVPGQRVCSLSSSYSFFV